MIVLPLNAEPVQLSAVGGVYSFSFTSAEAAALLEVYLQVRPVETEQAGSQTFRLTVSEQADFSQPTATAEVVVDGLADGRSSEGGVFELSQPVVMIPERVYFLQIENLKNWPS